MMIEIVNELKCEVFQPGWWKLSVPAIMFVVQNNLQYIAASNLSVPLFQITYQLKILTTALCSVLLLNRTLYKSQWIALFLLSIGVAAVQLHAQAEDHPSRPALEKVQAPKQMNQLLGLVSVLLACLSSGFASVYLERVLKSTSLSVSSKKDSSSSNQSDPIHPSSEDSSTILQTRFTFTSVWIRNIQLSFFGFLMGGIIVKLEQQKASWEMRWGDESLWWWESLEEDHQLIEESPRLMEEFWMGFNWMVWLVIGFQVLGGLLNALVIKFSDNIAKGFATSVSILISFGLSLILFEFKLSLGSLIGIGLVIFSTWFFNLSQDRLNELIRKLDFRKS
ncbi:nucleotide-sugar transporter-domain-containing protein [Melampsora americana]|nr:nucleotide-sugar transporter-domain-containing protein [Melampsora americana]